MTNSHPEIWKQDTKKRKARNFFESSLLRLQPTEYISSEEKLQSSPPFRNLFCPFYNTCLTFVVLQHPTWTSFTCSTCPHKSNDSGKADIQPSEILRTVNSIYTKSNIRAAAPFLRLSDLRTITQGGNDQPTNYHNKTKLPGRKITND